MLISSAIFLFLDSTRQALIDSLLKHSLGTSEEAVLASSSLFKPNIS